MDGKLALLARFFLEDPTTQQLTAKVPTHTTPCRTMRFTFALVAVCCVIAGANANVQSGARAVGVARAERQLVETKVAVTAAAVKGKAVPAAPTGFLTKELKDKLQLAGLFAVWYAFNAGCKSFFFSIFFCLSPAPSRFDSDDDYLLVFHLIPALRPFLCRQRVQCVCEEGFPLPLDYFNCAAVYRPLVRPASVGLQVAQDAQRGQGRLDEAASYCWPQRLWPHVRSHCHV